MGFELYWRKGPNIAVLAMLAVPFVGLIVAGLESAGVPLRQGAGAEIAVCSLASLVAAATLAARLEIAPTLSAALMLAAWLIGGGGDCTFFMMAGVGLAFWRKEVFDQGFDLKTLPYQISHGIAVFLKDTPGAAGRAATGALLCAAAGIVVGMAMAGLVAQPPRIVLLGLIGGIALLASSVVVPDDA